jgi:hypothetical protein
LLSSKSFFRVRKNTSLFSLKVKLSSLCQTPLCIQVPKNDSYRLSLDECFGTWIHNGVWQSDESLTFKENKEVFFLTLKKLLDDNKVVFFPPEPNSKIKKYKYCSNGEYYVDSGEYEEELWVFVFFKS